MLSSPAKAASLALLSGAMLLLAQPAAQANLLINGSFEDNASPGSVAALDGDAPQNSDSLSGSGLGSWEVYENLPGWTSPTGVIEIQTGGTIPLAPFVGNGKNYVELDANPLSNANSSMQQTFEGGSAAGLQTLSYYYSPRPGQPQGTNGIYVYFNDMVNPIAALTGNGPPPTGWTLLSAQVNVLTDTNTLRFVAFGTGDTLGGFIDKVVVTPIPAAAWLFGSAFLGLCWLGRRAGTRGVGMLPAA